MTVTIPAQTDEIRIVERAPTATDAQLLLQLIQTGAATGADEGWSLLQAFDSPPTMSQLRRRHPQGTVEYRQVGAFLESCETLGTFVKHGLIHRGLTHDLFWVAGAWRICEKLCRALRKEAGEPRLFENFEALARTGD